MLKSKKNSAFVALMSIFLFCAKAEAKIFDMTEFYLKNGLQVIVIPNHKAPIVRQMVWYKVGSVDEAMGKGGTAHLLEHLMFRGTKKVKDSKFNSIVAQNGGDSNAFTAQDFTSYYETMDVGRLELAMALEADRMENLDFSKKSFKKERDIVFQERMQVVENNPSAYFGEALLTGSEEWGSWSLSKPLFLRPMSVLCILFEPNHQARSSANWCLESNRQRLSYTVCIWD